MRPGPVTPRAIECPAVEPCAKFPYWHGLAPVLWAPCPVRDRRVLMLRPWSVRRSNRYCLLCWAAANPRIWYRDFFRWEARFRVERPRPVGRYFPRTGFQDPGEWWHRARYPHDTRRHLDALAGSSWALGPSYKFDVIGGDAELPPLGLLERDHGRAVFYPWICSAAAAERAAGGGA